MITVRLKPDATYTSWRRQHAQTDRPRPSGDLRRSGSFVDACGAALAPPQVTAQDLRDGLKDPTRWLNYGGDYGSQRHSPLTQITPANVEPLTAQWAFQTARSASSRRRRSCSTASSTSPGRTTRRGRSTRAPAARLWRYRRDLPERLIVCCGRVNRGFAVLGDRLFMTTLDAHLLALDMKTGAVVWDTSIDDYKARLQRHGGAAGREGQGHRRHRRRRVRHPRLHRRLRRADRQAGVAVLHACRARASRATRPGEARTEGVEARRRIDLGHRRVRSRAEPDRTGAPAMPDPTTTAATARATTSTPRRSSRSTPTPAS